MLEKSEEGEQSLPGGECSGTEVLRVPGNPSKGQHDAREPSELDQAVEQVWRAREIIRAEDANRGFLDAAPEKDQAFLFVEPS